MADRQRELNLESHRTIEIYARLVGARIRGDWQYRSAFVVTTALQLVSSFLGFAGVVVVFHNVPRVAGWSFADVALLWGMSATSFNLADTFVSQVEEAETHIRAGSFDSFLIRPLSPMVQLCAREFAYRRITKIVHALVILGLGIGAAQVAWSPVNVVVLVVTIVAGAVIFGALWVIYCSVAFWTMSTGEFVYAAVTGGQVAGEYPLDVFSPWLRRWFTGVMPIAFVAYYPAAWLLGHRSDPSLSFAGPVVACLLAALAAAAWRSGIRHYRGTGS